MTIETTAAQAAQKPKLKSDWLLRYSTLIVLGVMFLGFALFVDRFLTVFNLANIMQQISILGDRWRWVNFWFCGQGNRFVCRFHRGLGGNTDSTIVGQ